MLLLKALVAAGLSAGAHISSRQAGSASDDQTFDYVIVGGGVSGLILAARLSEDLGKTVGLFEAGSDPSENATVNIPFFDLNLQGTRYSWNYSSTPQPQLGGVAPTLAQGFGLGGGSIINLMGYCRGSASVYDEWAEISGIEELRWDNILNEFRDNTNLEIPPGNDYPQAINSSTYGDGPLKLSYLRNKDAQAFAPLFLDAFLNDTEFPTEPEDLTDGTGIGASFNGPYAIRLSNSTRAYSLPAYGWQAATRPNVELRHDAWVTKINFADKRAVSIEYVDQLDGSTHTVKGNEIILSAGALSTPKLLMLSGIGPKNHLDEMGIDVVQDNPDVGSHLVDHQAAAVMIQAPDSYITTVSLENASVAASLEDEYSQFRRGPLATPGSTAFVAQRIPDDVLESLGVNVTFHLNLPADRPHVLFQYADSPYVADKDNLNPISAFAAVVQPEATGFIRLNSSDYRIDPLIFSNYWGTEGDFAIQLWAYKRLLSIFRSDAIAPLRVSEIFPGSDVQSDEGIEDAVKESARSFHHPCGTASLGRVLDTSFRVKGLEGLRVVDTSAMPYPPTCHQQASMYALAEVAAKVIRRDDSALKP